MVLQLRIDERLTHGQVCTAWINAIGASHVVVANDEVAGDDFMKNIMSLGMPNHVKSIFTTLDKTVGILNDERSKHFKIFLVTKTPQDALYIIDRVNDPIKEVNLANYGALMKANVKNKLTLNVFVLLDEDDVKCVKEIKSKVADLFFQDIVAKPKSSINL